MPDLILSSEILTCKATNSSISLRSCVSGVITSTNFDSSLLRNGASSRVCSNRQSHSPRTRIISLRLQQLSNGPEPMSRSCRNWLREMKSCHKQHTSERKDIKDKQAIQQPNSGVSRDRYAPMRIACPISPIRVKLLVLVAGGTAVEIMLAVLLAMFIPRLLNDA